MDNINNSRKVFRKIINEHQHLLHLLPKKERQVIRLRYGLHDGKEYTLKYIGELYLVSDTRIAQIEGKARDRVYRYIHFLLAHRIHEMFSEVVD